MLSLYGKHRDVTGRVAPLVMLVEMSFVFDSLVRPALFALSRRDPEVAHELVMRPLALVSRMPPALRLVEALVGAGGPARPREALGLWFRNPVGLAGGFDKNGLALPALAALGFGFIEAGGVTRFPQAGQPRPRIIRFPADGALINRMGLPNLGADAVAARLSRAPRPAIPIGWQIAKSKDTPLEEAPEDCAYTLRKLYPYGDYFSVNVSSPNTPGLRTLQERGPLEALLRILHATARELAGSGQPKPILLKIAPDLDWPALDDILAACLNTGVGGIIATNTTTAREGLHSATDEAGGLSGRPLGPRARAVVRYLADRLGGRLPIIGVGGIFTPDDARAMFDAGATLIQIYTSFIYQGPGLIARINRAIK